MRRATITNRALLVLLASFVVALALGDSPEQTKVRVTTWNLEWFPNGSAHDATPEVQAFGVGICRVTARINSYELGDD